MRGVPALFRSPVAFTQVGPSDNLDEHSLLPDALNCDNIHAARLCDNGLALT